MKKFAIVFILLLLSAQVALSQQITVPKSRVIDANRLIEDVKILSADDMQGRQIDTPGGAKAREYVRRRFEKSGLKSFGNSFEQPFEYTNRNNEKRSGANIVGFIKGKQHPEKYIVVTAHYDHVGVNNGEIYNGADDNASGTAALFALAKYFSKNRPANSIIFAALDGEEAGLRGARAFIENPTVKKESILLNVNLDMISHNDSNEIYAVGTYHYPFLKPYIDKVAKTANVKILFGHEGPNVSPDKDWTNQSDHAVFHREKIPFIYFGVEDHKDYHKPTDDFANINQAFYVRAVETILASLKEFDRKAADIENDRRLAADKRG